MAGGKEIVRKGGTKPGEKKLYKGRRAKELKYQTTQDHVLQGRKVGITYKGEKQRNGGGIEKRADAGAKDRTGKARSEIY